MRAITQAVYGEADVLTLSDLPIPTPASDELLIEVRAAGVDQATWHLMTGLPLLARLAMGIPNPKQTTLGGDVAGVVSAVGSAVTEFAVGDEVYGVASGSFADYATAKPRNLAPKPARLTFGESAALPTSLITAYQGMRDRVKPGDRVLVLGAAGGVGGFAVQLAKAWGAEVTGAARASKLDLARRYGADHVVDYVSEPLGAGYDVVVDTGGNRSLREVRALLAPRGTAVLVGGEGAGGKLLAGFQRQLWAGILTRFIPQTLVPVVAMTRGHDLVDLAPLIESGAIVPVIDETYPLERTADAVRRLRNPQRRGKVVVEVSRD